MKKPVVDYRKLRFNNITSPEYRHLLWLIGWIGYLLMYILTENLIPAEKCYPVHCFLDDVIPFCEWFFIPYVSWYFLIAGSLVYFALYNTENFKNLQKYLIITQVVAMIAYVFLPTRQDLRPTEFVRDNFMTQIASVIYSVDTNTGVCPSLHVAYSIGIASTWLKESSASKLTKTLITILCGIICISVSFVKQHSVVDIIAAIPVCILAELVVFRGRYFGKKKKTAE